MKTSTLMIVFMTMISARAADTGVDGKIKETMQTYVDTLSSGQTKGILHGPFFKERLEKDKAELQACRKKPCTVQLREPVETITQNSKTHHHVYMDISQSSKSLIVRSGCYILEADGTSLTLVGYLTDCDGK